MNKYCIVIPAFNSDNTILQTLEGVDIALRQINNPIPVYVIDDCSTDNTRNVVDEFCSNSFELHLIVNEVNLGERGSLNFFYSFVREQFDWIFLLHADDVPNRDWLKRTIDVIEQNDTKNLFTVWSSFNIFNKQGVIETGSNSCNVVINNYPDPLRKFNYVILKTTSSFHISGCAIKLLCLNEINGFDANLPQYGDTDFYARSILAVHYDIYIAESLTNYRISDTSVTFKSYRTNRDVKEMLYFLTKFKKKLFLFVSLLLMIKVKKILFKRFCVCLYRFDFLGAYNYCKYLIFGF